MSFFERQRVAKTSTVRLVALFVLAVLSIVVAVDAVVVVVARNQTGSTLASLLVGVSAVTVLIIAGGSISKTIALRGGGSALALSLGAVAVDPTTSDPVLRRYINVVEEISLAAGVPVPRLFVLAEEPGINAFAAGYTPADAAVTVTGGALQQLNRDELQGVIGHEFSHVLNGDMRLNIRLIGLLNGILLLGLIGLRVAGSGGGRSKNEGPIVLIALAMAVFGFIGQFFANVIKAAVSRQREWLADASAVQFTRNPQGLEGALKKIAGLPTGSALRDSRNASEVSHMLFGEGRSRFSSMFATHPPLLERIAALDPTFRPAEIAALQQRWAAAPPNGLAEDAAMGLAGGPLRSVQPAVEPATVAPAQVSARVGTMSESDLQRGQRLSAEVPPRFRRLASQGSTAVPLVLAMLLSEKPDVRDVQLDVVAARLGRDTAGAAAELAADVSSLPTLLRLPVVSIAVPLIVERPQQQLDALVDTLQQLALADGTITVFEYCLTRMVAGYVHDASDPAGRSKPGKASVGQVRSAAFALLAVLAATGNADSAAARRAFDAAVAHLMPGERVAFTPPAQLAPALDGGWPALDSLDPRNKQRLVEALVVAIAEDGRLDVEEAELLRTACALLHCALPSFVA